jgi:hypothetical protein
MRQSNAVIAHDAVGQLALIEAPTQITFGRHDQVTSLWFADALTNGITGSELLVFETCAHAPIYQSTAEFNEKTLSFLNRHTAGGGERNSITSLLHIMPMANSGVRPWDVAAFDLSCMPARYAKAIKRCPVYQFLSRNLIALKRVDCRICGAL